MSVRLPYEDETRGPSSNLPLLEVRGPYASGFTIELAKDHMTIGRLAEFNDVVLDPDPQQLITRAHCAIEHTSGVWWIVDNGSTNGTFLKRGKDVQQVKGRVSIGDGDTIRILGRLTDGGDPAYWELTFRDPLKTRRFEASPRTTHLEYDWIQAKLFRISESSREEIEPLRPQEHKLIRYMDHRNRSNNNAPVVCMYEELISAIWAEEAGHTEAEINRLAWELRQKIELDSKAPQYLQTVRGLGYRLATGPQ